MHDRVGSLGDRKSGVPGLVSISPCLWEEREWAEGATATSWMRQEAPAKLRVGFQRTNTHSSWGMDVLAH